MVEDTDASLSLRNKYALVAFLNSTLQLPFSFSKQTTKFSMQSLPKELQR